MMNEIPLSLYVHLPWCVKKCPYCDFNSHEAKTTLPQDLYVASLKSELQSRLHLLKNRPIKSIFFGGGTPSLFSANSIGQILENISGLLTFDKNIEITMEANPGTIDKVHFAGFRSAGINRLSLGIQSLQDEKLKILGRIHDRANAMQAIRVAKQAGFDHFNLDLMYGLPHQSLKDALQDIQDALAFEPTHFSWYQLTIEPNTAFYRNTPPLPVEDEIYEMQVAGQEKLNSSGFSQYEVSAYASSGKECLHNRNYWEFGDYLGIGAGAHSKLSLDEIVRFSQVRHPKDYLLAEKRQALQLNPLSEKDLVFEFMLNALRLTDGVPLKLFTERTGIALEKIEAILTEAKKRGLLLDDKNILCASEWGKKFLNDLTMMFIDSRTVT